MCVKWVCMCELFNLVKWDVLESVSLQQNFPYRFRSTYTLCSCVIFKMNDNRDDFTQRRWIRDVHEAGVHDVFVMIFFPLNSFLNMFADLINLFLSPSFMMWMNACVIGFAGHSFLAFSKSIPTSFINSFKSCVTSDSVVSRWNPVVTVFPWFSSTCFFFL